MEDPDGAAYPWKKMPDGNLWLVENLDFYIPGESWAYDNEPSKRGRNGLLYTVEGASLACEALGGGWPSVARCGTSQKGNNGSLG